MQVLVDPKDPFNVTLEILNGLIAPAFTQLGDLKPRLVEGQVTNFKMK